MYIYIVIVTIIYTDVYIHYNIIMCIYIYTDTLYTDTSRLYQVVHHMYVYIYIYMRESVCVCVCACVCV